MIYYFVYQTKNLINNKTYIGVHKTSNIDDGYIGCGIYTSKDGKKLRRKIVNKSAIGNAINKYGVENFKREILSFYDSYEEILEEEKYLVNEDWVKSDNNYNCVLGGGNGSKGYKYTEEQLKRRSESHKGKKLSEEHKLKLKNSNIGKKHSEQAKQKMSIARKKYNFEEIYLNNKELFDTKSTWQIHKITDLSTGTIQRIKKYIKNER